MKKLIDLSLINKGETIAVALSGGKDSMVLLNLLLSLKKELSITVKAINVDHCIRGEESVKDSEFVKNYCKKLGVPLKTYVVDAPQYSRQNHLSLEQGARALRYNAFNDAIACGFADKIATAHHKSDNLETVLLNLFRGASLKGLAGIPKTTGAFIRPLLPLTRKQIDDYASKNDIPFVQDQTNADVTYTRNYIRNEIIPTVLARFPEAEESAYRFTKTARQEDEFLDELSTSLIEEKSGKLYVSLSENPVLLRRAIIIALKRLGISKDYEAVHVHAVENLKTLQSGAIVTLPKNVIALKEYGKVAFFVDESTAPAHEYRYGKGTFYFGDLSAIITSGSLLELKTALVFDGAKIPPNAVIRTRREGDVFEKFGGGTKKLKEYLIDKKIPLLERDNLPVIASGNKIYVIFGVAIADSVKVTEKTKKLYKAELK